jgi:hypothetical protein
VFSAPCLLDVSSHYSITNQFSPFVNFTAYPTSTRTPATRNRSDEEEEEPQYRTAG